MHVACGSGEPAPGSFNADLSAPSQTVLQDQYTWVAQNASVLGVTLLGCTITSE
jgi:hypothetical protein